MARKNSTSCVKQALASFLTLRTAPTTALAESKFLSLNMFFLLVAASFLLLVSPVAAETIYSCYHKTNGNLRVVSAPGQCHKNSEHELSWKSGSEFEQVVNSLSARVDAIESAIGLFNEPPTVSVGADQTILLADSAYFEASATDDGILGPLTYRWEKVAGPGDASFSNPTSNSTDVWFTEPGVYEVALYVDDGYATVSDSATVVVYPDNSPPTVDAGEDLIDDALVVFYSSGYMYIRSCSYDLEAIVEDDGIPLPYTVTWSIDYDSKMQYPATTYAFFPWGWRFDDTTSASVLFYDFGIRYSYGPSPYNYFHAFSVDLTVSVNDGYYTTTDTVRVYCRSPYHPDWLPDG